MNFDAYKGKIVDAIGKSTVPIKAGDMAALRTMYNSDTGNMNTVLETMVKKRNVNRRADYRNKRAEEKLIWVHQKDI